MKGRLLVAGTMSNAGKTVVTAGICRWLARQGIKVSPFKAQNISLNSMVTAEGAEIGRAQAMQAAAAGVEPEAAMNPVLLKPGNDGHSQVVLLGRPVTEASCDLKSLLQKAILDSFAALRSRYDVVVCEGAGSLAEINLRERDLANMGLARAADMPTIVVGDIDRGGALAALFGTLAVLCAEDQALVSGFVINKFRGDRQLLAPGLDMLRELTGRPTLGVLPWLPGLWLDSEDVLDLESRPEAALPAVGTEMLRIAVVRLPRLSNVTDIDPLTAEPGVMVRLATRPEELADADLVIVPGTRATVPDLAWLRENGLADAISRRAAQGRQTLGICGGYQMLARTIHDDVEARAGTVAGLGLLPATVTFSAHKTLGRSRGAALGHDVEGYEIRHGVVHVDGGEGFLDGCVAGPVAGTSWHGIFENDGFRQEFLRRVAHLTGRRYLPVPGVSFAALREQRLDRLGDLVAEHLDTEALLRLIEQGPTPGRPTLHTQLI